MMLNSNPALQLRLAAALPILLPFHLCCHESNRQQNMTQQQKKHATHCPPVSSDRYRQLSCSGNDSARLVQQRVVSVADAVSALLEPTPIAPDRITVVKKVDIDRILMRNAASRLPPPSTTSIIHSMAPIDTERLACMASGGRMFSGEIDCPSAALLPTSTTVTFDDETLLHSLGTQGMASTEASDTGPSSIPNLMNSSCHAQATRKGHREKWNARYQDLVEFRRRTGHCLVPLEYQENPPLAHWIKRQRCQYSKRHRVIKMICASQAHFCTHFLTLIDNPF